MTDEMKNKLNSLRLPDRRALFRAVQDVRSDVHRGTVRVGFLPKDLHPADYRIRDEPSAGPEYIEAEFRKIYVDGKVARLELERLDLPDGYEKLRDY